MIHLYSPQEIKRIAASAKILANTLKLLLKETKAGVSLKYLDELAFDFIKKSGAEPAFLGYHSSGAKHPFPYSICASLNNVIVHGRPTDYKLKNGDVLKIDCGVKYKNYYSDAAFTINISGIGPIAEKLIKATRVALDEAIKYAKPGNRLGDIGWAIENTAKKAGFKIIEGLTGHGIGFNLHEEPTIYNYGKKGKGIELKTGMVLAIEPMLSVGSERLIQKADESWATADDSLSAHFEHTVAITPTGPRILTNL